MEQRAEYPSLDGIEENLEYLRAVSPAYAGRASEMTAILQYVFQGIVLGETGKTAQAKTMMRIAADEMHHLEILGTLICKLGASPVFTRCPPYPVGFYCASAVNYTKDLKNMIEADLCGEETAIAGYEQMLKRIKDERVCAVISRIVEDEKRHIVLLKAMLDDL